MGEVGQLGCGGVAWGWGQRVGKRNSIKGCGKINPLCQSLEVEVSVEATREMGMDRGSSLVWKITELRHDRMRK